MIGISRKFTSKNNASAKLTQEDNKTNGNGIILRNEFNWYFNNLFERNNSHKTASDITWFDDGISCRLLSNILLFCVHFFSLSVKFNSLHYVHRQSQPPQLKSIEMILSPFIRLLHARNSDAMVFAKCNEIRSCSRNNTNYLIQLMVAWI